MHLKKLNNVRYDEQFGTFKIAGEDSFGKTVSVYFDVKNTELFINAIKSAIQKYGENIELV